MNQNYIKVIEFYPAEVMIKVNTELYQTLLQMIQPQNVTEVSEVSVITPDFLRRIVPFFMNQFYLWTMFKKDDNLIRVRKTLQKLKEDKISNQKKFELGDLKLIYNSKGQKYNLIRQAWKDFLYSDEISNCISNNNKIKQNSKISYKEAINLLRNELQKQFPYTKLLSKYRQDHRDRQPQPDIQSQEEDFISQENEYSTFNGWQNQKVIS